MHITNMQRQPQGIVLLTTAGQIKLEILSARIIHVVDVFDALTSTRSYRRAYVSERAIRILREDAGTKLDADVVEHLVAAWNALPTTHPARGR